MASDSLVGVKFELVVCNASALTESYSENCNIRGFIWQVVVTKREFKGKQHLAIFLNSKNEDPNDDWIIFAKASFKLISNKLQIKPYETFLPPQPFSSRYPAWGFASFLSWNELMDDSFGFIVDDTFKITIDVESGELQRITQNEMIKKDTIHMFVDNCHELLQLEIKIPDDFIGLCSPKFFLRDFPWQIAVLRNNNQITGYDFLEVHLINMYEISEHKWECRADLIVTLVALSSQGQSEEKISRNIQFSWSHTRKRIFKFPWKEFVDPRKQFIENYSLIKISINIHEVLGLPPKSQKPYTDLAVPLDCIICGRALSNGPVSITRCGHMFCKSCIEDSLKRREVCPMCNQEAKYKKLVPVFLPIK